MDRELAPRQPQHNTLTATVSVGNAAPSPPHRLPTIRRPAAMNVDGGSFCVAWPGHAGKEKCEAWPVRVLADPTGRKLGRRQPGRQEKVSLGPTPRGLFWNE